MQDAKQSSLNKETAAQVLDTVSRLSVMAGEANDAVAACTQVKMKDATRLLKLLETECSTMCVRLSQKRRAFRIFARQ